MDTTQVTINMLYNNYCDQNNKGHFRYTFSGFDQDKYTEDFKALLKSEKDALYDEYCSMIFALNHDNSNLQNTCRLIISKIQTNGYPIKFWKYNEERKLMNKLKTINKVMKSNQQYIQGLEKLLPVKISPYDKYLLMHDFLKSKGFILERSTKIRTTSIIEVWTKTI